jgi:Tfp pilus assembly protein PilO
MASSIQNKNLVSVGLIIICSATAFYLYSSIWPEYNDAKAQKSQQQSENARLNEALASIQSFIEDYEEVSNDAKGADLFLPHNHPDLANFINNLSELAQASGVTLAGFQIGEREPQRAIENSIQVVEISFNSSGSYLSLRDFISRLQTNLRLIDIQTISISTAQEGEGTPILEFQVKLKIYYQQ